MLTNPFSEIASVISPEMMQAYVILMILFVVGGTLFDVWHKKSAKFFKLKTEELKSAAKRNLSSGEKTGMALKTLSNEVLTSGEFQNPRRRVSHLMTMYGFIIFVVSTAVMIFGDVQSGIWPLLWHLGALSLLIGAAWFWFFIRVDVFSEGHKWYDVHRDDMFVVSLILMSLLALVWSVVGGWLTFSLFIAAATFLFSTVIWSKFAHMFFKPAAAYQKRVSWADGSREYLPDVPDLTDPEVQKRFPDIPTYMGEKPPYMGLGIKREKPNHY